MKQTKAILYQIFLWSSILGTLVCSYAVINTMVSLKYETEGPDDCISLVTGIDLCLTIKIIYLLITICVLVTILLLIFRKRILK